MSNNSRYMKRLGELLVFHRIINSPEELKEENFDEKIMEFQEKEDIRIDADPGEDTLWHLQYPWVLQSEKLLFVRCEADQVPGSGGYSSLLLREDAAENYRALRQDVLDHRGVITTAGGKRSLSTGANASRSATSMHYTGLAFDLAIDSGFFSPDNDTFVITRGEDGYWVVWCRASGGEETELKAVYWESWNSGVDLEKTIEGKYINFTEICAKHGFYPIRPRSGFTRSYDRKYLSAEWWHFQANDLLIPNLSQFGIELLRIEDYTPEFIKTSNEHIWSKKNAIFKVDWS